jgi:hypothetical protein
MENTGNVLDDHDCSAAGVRIELADGSVDYILASLYPDRIVTAGEIIRFAAMYAIVRVRGDVVEQAMLYGGTDLSFMGKTILKTNSAFAKGTVVDFTREPSTNYRIIVELDADDNPEPDISSTEPYISTGTNLSIGSYIYVDSAPSENIKNGDVRNAVFEIIAFEREGDTRSSIDIGDVSLIHGFVDPMDHSRGYKYLIEKSDRFSIPAVKSYMRRSAST